MLHKLRERWKVKNIDLVLIICTFALGGSLCGWLGRKLLLMTGVEKGAEWILIYIITITILWPPSVLMLSIPFGQFSFFKNYISNVLAKISGRKRVICVAIFASGAGSNAQKIINRFKKHPFINIALIVSNRPAAGVVSIASGENIPSLLIDKKKFFEGDSYLPELEKYKIDFIVLAGFLWKMPPVLIQAFPDKIINIHPALLPMYGGQGMYGNKVHEAVINAKEKESGISIHYVDDIYDHGKIIFQATCAIDDYDTAGTLAQKVHGLEHEHYPAVIERLLQNTKG